MIRLPCQPRCMPPPRPRIKPALRPLWRNGSTLQLGVDPAHAVVIGGLDPGSAKVLTSLDGTRDLPGVTAAAAALGVDAARLDELFAVLTRAGVLEDGADETRPLSGLSRVERDRLGPDLAAASLLAGAGGSGVSTLERRRCAVVQVFGAGRVGSTIVSLLAAAGVGAVVVEDSGVTRDADVTPAGPCPEDVGSRRQDAAVRAARRAAPSMRSGLPMGRPLPDLAVLTAAHGADAPIAERMVRDGVPHLFARVRETTGVIGPFVVPGRTSCLRCHDLHRTDRDPAWPSIVAQLSSGARDRPVACDVVLATAVAAHASLHVLSVIDGDLEPTSVDGTWEISPRDGGLRRRSWSVHPVCGCGWASEPDTFAETEAEAVPR